MRAAGAHVSTDHGPLQPLVMCACHRTSPTATPLACDGLYSATAAEQRGLHYPKLMTFNACHYASGATAVRDLHAGARTDVPHELSRTGAGVRASTFRAARTRTLPNAPKLQPSNSRQRSGADRRYSKGPRRRRRRVNEEIFSASEGV